jgi:hypothetical protein
LAENVVFNSPIFARPLVGRELVARVFAASAGVRFGQYTAEYKIGERLTMLRWAGKIEGRSIESLEIIEDSPDGLIVERTLAFRPLPALQLFKDAIYPILKDKVPADVWSYGDSAPGE